MSSRRNPFDEIERMFERMSRQFDRAAGDLGTELEPLVSEPVRVDLEDRGEELVLTADLPGFDREDIDLRLAGETLHLEATHEEAAEEHEDESGTYVRKERRHRSVSRTVSLPEAVDEEAVSAEYRNGVLTVTLPKLGGGSGREIDID